MSNNIKVLLADDEQIHLVAYRDYLRDEGFDVEPVEDAQGVEVYAAKAQVLVIDARLPTAQLEGLEIVAKLIRERKIASFVPVIFISVHSEEDDLCQQKLKQLQCLAGRYFWLQKPFELEMLAKTIWQVLDQREIPPRSEH